MINIIGFRLPFLVYAIPEMLRTVGLPIERRTLFGEEGPPHA